MPIRKMALLCGCVFEFIWFLEVTYIDFYSIIVDDGRVSTPNRIVSGLRFSAFNVEFGGRDCEIKGL